MPKKKTISSEEYFEYIESEAVFAGSRAIYVTKPGIPYWQDISPSEHLIAEYIHVEPEANYLLMGCGKGLSVAWIAKQLSSGCIWTTDILKTAIECTKRTLEINKANRSYISPDISLLPDQNLYFSIAIIILPKGRDLARRWLLEAYKALKQGGEIYLVGANTEGIKSTVKDAEILFHSESTVIGYKKGHRIARLVKKDITSNPSWATEAGIAPGTWISFTLKINNNLLNFTTLPGVFSFQHLDEGTSLLLDVLKVDTGDIIADVGCGYGIIGTVAGKPPFNPKEIDMVDNNLLAVASAKQTITRNYNLEESKIFKVLAGDLLVDFNGKKYSLILTNPPFHSGKATDYSITTALIQQASQSLLPGGRLVLVANKFIRYEQLLKQFFTSINILKENNRFQVIEARNDLL